MTKMIASLRCATSVKAAASERDLPDDPDTKAAKGDAMIPSSESRMSQIQEAANRIASSYELNGEPVPSRWRVELAAVYELHKMSFQAYSDLCVVVESVIAHSADQIAALEAQRDELEIHGDVVPK